MEVEIKDKQLIRVATAGIKTKEYDGSRFLEFTTNQGKTWKITEKREHLWEMFVPGAAIEISIAEFKNRDYIAHAEQNLTPPPEEVPPPGVTVEAPPQYVDKPPAKTDKDKAIAEAVAYKAINLHIVKDQMEKVFGDEAPGLLVWYRDKTLEWAYRK